MKRVIVLAAATLGSFALTILYLQKQRDATPMSSREPSVSLPVQRASVTSGAADAPLTQQWTAMNEGPTPRPTSADDPVSDGDAPTALGIQVASESAQDPAGDDHAVERRQLEDFAGGIQHVAPISAVQKQSLLEAKLRHKQAYETVLRDSGLERERLSTAERAYAHQLVARALQEYRDNYLLEAQAALSVEQYTLLRNYESTEFRHELERLQTAINSR